MKLREAKRLVKAKAITTYERVYLPVYYVTMMMRFHSLELRATGVAICQPEDEWRPVVGAGIARSKAIAQLVQQVMTLDGIERKQADLVSANLAAERDRAGRVCVPPRPDNVYKFVKEYLKKAP